MTRAARSCAVALPTQRNNATHVTAATHAATGIGETGSKSLSVKELRAQLRAQQTRNQCATEADHVAEKVALDTTENQESCAVALPRERNCATDLVQELMEVDGLSRVEAERIAAIGVTGPSPDEWLAMIAELDSLIETYARTYKLDADALARITDSRRRQPLSTIPESIAWFRQAIAKAPRKTTEAR